jgi:hypothetical protein
VSIGTCTISAGLYCTFTTNHFSYFAVGAPISNSSNNTTGPGGPTYSSWGGGGSYVGTAMLDRVYGSTVLPIVTNSLNSNIIKLTPKNKLVRYIQKVLFFPKTNYTVTEKVIVKSTKSITSKKGIGTLKK